MLDKISHLLYKNTNMGVMGSFIKSVITFPKTYFFEIQTGLGRSAVRDILETEVVKPLPFISYRFFSSKFVGEFHSSGFDIRIDVWYNPGFNPVFHGSYKETDKGVVVGVEASNNLATLWTVVMWISSAIELYFAFSSLLRGNYQSAGILVVIAIATAASAIGSAAVYNRTVRDGRRKLVSILSEKNKDQRKS